MHQHDHRWVLILSLTATGFLAFIAARLSVLRDVGAGLIPARPGCAEAPASLRAVFGLAWCLQRGTLAAWTVGLSVIGSSFGVVGKSVDDLVDNDQQLAEMLATLVLGALVTVVFAFAPRFASAIG